MCLPHTEGENEFDLKLTLLVHPYCRRMTPWEHQADLAWSREGWLMGHLLCSLKAARVLDPAGFHRRVTEGSRCCYGWSSWNFRKGPLCDREDFHRLPASF